MSVIEVERGEPFDGGPYMTESGWSTMWSTALADGVIEFPTNDAAKSIDGLRVYALGDGRQVYVSPGQAIIRGHLYTLSETKVIQLPLNSTGLDRIDSIVVRLDTAAKTIVTDIRTGGTTHPVLTQIPGGVWELRLGNVNAVTTNVATAADKVADTRKRTGPMGFDNWYNYLPVAFQVPSGPAIASQAGQVARFKIVGDTAFVFVQQSVALTTPNGAAYGMTLPVAPRYAEVPGAARVQNTAGHVLTRLPGVQNAPATGAVVLLNNDHTNLASDGVARVDSFNICYEIAQGA